MSNMQRIRPGHAALRRGRHSRERQVYLVTFTTEDRAPHFSEDDTAIAAARAIEDPRLWRDSQLDAWVLMPDHWHGLISLGADDELSSLVQKLKTNVSRRVRDARPDISKVWSVGFHDHALRAQESVTEAARYIIRNPVEAGLVRRIGDYPYWNAAWV
jgi:REP element-mobilizing transposase RayT